LTADVGANLRSAQAVAKTHAVLYQEASQKFGKYIEDFRGDVPRTLGVAHILRVNPALEIAPYTPAQTTQRGFMQASTVVARDSGFTLVQMDKPSVGAYVWGKEINRMAKELQHEYGKYFPASGADFWKCVYLKYALGRSAFKKLWDYNLIFSTGEVYTALVNTAAGLQSAIPPWSVTGFRHLVLYNCAYVIAFTDSRGTLVTSGYGKTPTLNKTYFLEMQ